MMDNQPFNVTGGGTNAPWNWGTSPFDLASIINAFNRSSAMTSARYAQLGIEAPGGGPSTMEGQDLGTVPSVTGGLPQEAAAVQGEEQTANVSNPALNPALQPQIQAQIGPTAGQTATTLGNLAGKALATT